MGAQVHIRVPIFRDAAVADAPALAELKRRTFRETFVDGPLAIGYSEQDLKLYEAKSYDPDVIRADLAHPDHHHWVAEDEDGAMVAYAHVGPCHLPHPEADATQGELYQLYVADHMQGAGLGRALLDRAMEWLALHRPGPIWLGVFSGNVRAQAVYASRGFVKVGEYDFQVGAHRDREFILRRPAQG